MAISSRLPVAVAPPPSSAAFGGGRRYTNHQHHRRSTAGSWAFLLCASALLVAWILYTAASLQHQAHQLHTGAHHLRSPPTLDELYGPQDGRWPSSAASGPSQLLVLSYYSSKASLAARLLMLLGVYAGEPSQLRIDGRDLLRWWELRQLTTLNDLVLQQHATPGLPHHLARGFHTSSLSRDDLDYYQDRLSGITTYLSKRRPWLLKDPRLSWLAPLWLEQLESPVCVLVCDMQPQQLAQRLALQQQQERLNAAAAGRDQQQQQQEVDVSAGWTNATLSSLKACFGVPTLIIPNSVLQPPLVQPYMQVLQQHLTAIGVQGVRLPPAELFQQQYLAHLRVGATYRSHCAHADADSASNNSSSVQGAAILQEACNWLPPPPHTGSAGAQEGHSSDGASGQAVDAQMLPMPTQALLSALHEHLLANLAHPSTALQYSRTAGLVYNAYTSKVKQMVAQNGRHTRPGEHHSIGALIVEALRHVESTVAAATHAPHR